MIRNISIFSGLILFAFITTHLLSISVALHSLDWLEASRPYFFVFWLYPPIELLLILCFIIHPILGMRALYYRNSLRMTMQDKVQLISALLIIPLLIPHLFGIKAALFFLGIEPSYKALLRLMWVDSPLEGLRQVLLLIVVWVHGCTGLLTWLKLKDWWGSVAKFIYPLAVAIPTLALLGFVEGGRARIEALGIEQTAVSNDGKQVLYSTGYGKYGHSSQTLQSTATPYRKTEAYASATDNSYSQDRYERQPTVKSYQQTDDYSQTTTKPYSQPYAPAPQSEVEEPFLNDEAYASAADSRYSQEKYERQPTVKSYQQRDDYSQTTTKPYSDPYAPAPQSEVEEPFLNDKAYSSATDNSYSQEKYERQPTVKSYQQRDYYSQTTTKPYSQPYAPAPQSEVEEPFLNDKAYASATDNSYSQEKYDRQGAVKSYQQRDDYSQPTTKPYSDPYAPAPQSEVEEPSVNDEAYQQSKATMSLVVNVYWGILVGVFLARFIRLRKYSKWIKIRYDTGEVIHAKVGPTLLELAIANNVPHASLCRGKGRCGTCRVKLLNASSPLAPANDLEKALLEQLECSADVRLACQVVSCETELELSRILPADIQLQQAVEFEKDVKEEPLL